MNAGMRRRLPALVLALLAACTRAATDEHAAADLRRAARDTFFPAWADSAPYNEPLKVLDTESALGRLDSVAKTLTLRDVALVHGHLCDGLVIAWVELGVALRALFPDGVVDRTDARVVAKNGPCWADAAAWTTGARVNHGTLILDNAVGDGFIVQRISTGATVRVGLHPGTYPDSVAALERAIRSSRARNLDVSATEIDRFETGAVAFSRWLLNTPPDQFVTVESLDGFVFPTSSPGLVVPRSDVINRDRPRAPSLPPRERARHRRGAPRRSGEARARQDSNFVATFSSA